MKCPKCYAAFEQVQTPLGDLERCSGCKGLWLDYHEIEDLKPIADAIDIGCEGVGKTLNNVDRISCPICPNNNLLRMVDPKQPHIWYESCPTCKGRFYDAGEFKDLAKVDLFDFFKRFSIKERY
ncbi:zf-TFIIB domain-containing protein [Vibrio sp. D431a]|uniref:zf-TFIIB domain-containing protein n=1 Tax=Vibrio sp. D431a TaxID=2837388 RepID=UPI00256A0271|nr:zf-TFIIB domain-containing protein [Vibrio sp. D431a]MDK9790048.1 zf-TFIIB domain-containing protein [Vibrio sp. D431a]